MCRDGMGRAGYVPSLLCAELTRHQQNVEQGIWNIKV